MHLSFGPFWNVHNFAESGCSPSSRVRVVLGWSNKNKEFFTSCWRTDESSPAKRLTLGRKNVGIQDSFWNATSYILLDLLVGKRRTLEVRSSTAPTVAVQATAATKCSGRVQMLEEIWHFFHQLIKKKIYQWRKSRTIPSMWLWNHWSVLYVSVVHRLALILIVNQLPSCWLIQISSPGCELKWKINR